MRKVDKAVSVTIIIMQRLHQNDPSAVMLEKEKHGGAKVKHINLPAEIEGDGMDVVRPRKLAALYKDGLLDPIRLPRRVLVVARVSLGPVGYAGQMLQSPTPREGAMFKVERLQIDTPPREIDFKQKVRYWDKASTSGKRNKDACFTVGVLMGLDKKGQFWILDVVRGQWETNQREDWILSTASLDRQHHPMARIGIEQEPGSGGKESAEATIRRLAGFRVTVDRPSGDKELRADPYSVQVNAGNVFIARGEWNKEYVEELQFFPLARFKDQVDASSGAFAMLTQYKPKLGALFSNSLPHVSASPPVQEGIPNRMLAQRGVRNLTG
jgi:predicted phage terminase large subunit-like protein